MDWEECHCYNLQGRALAFWCKNCHKYLKMVAPSFVTWTCPSFLPMPHKILSMPRGPRVVLTRSPTAMAPTKEERRAISAFSSSASCFITRTGLRETCKSPQEKYEYEFQKLQPLVCQFFSLILYSIIIHHILINTGIF